MDTVDRRSVLFGGMIAVLAAYAVGGRLDQQRRDDTQDNRVDEQIDAQSAAEKDLDAANARLVSTTAMLDVLVRLTCDAYARVLATDRYMIRDLFKAAAELIADGFDPMADDLWERATDKLLEARSAPDTDG